MNTPIGLDSNKIFSEQSDASTKLQNEVHQAAGEQLPAVPLALPESQASQPEISQEAQSLPMETGLQPVGTAPSAMIPAITESGLQAESETTNASEQPSVVTVNPEIVAQEASVAQRVVGILDSADGSLASAEAELFKNSNTT